MISGDWIYGLIGGLMIGTAVVIYLLVSGWIMGASGILGGLIDGSGRATAVERGSFVGGLVLIPFVVAILVGAPATNITPNMALLVIGGLAVGFGTRIGNGCTSGHGVCGISHFSKRGIVVKLVYLATGGVTLLVLRHGLGWV